MTDPDPRIDFFWIQESRTGNSSDVEEWRRKLEEMGIQPLSRLIFPTSKDLGGEEE